MQAIRGRDRRSDLDVTIGIPELSWLCDPKLRGARVCQTLEFRESDDPRLVES